jgi:hypothetical protein
VSIQAEPVPAVGPASGTHAQLHDAGRAPVVVRRPTGWRAQPVRAERLASSAGTFELLRALWRAFCADDPHAAVRRVVAAAAAVLEAAPGEEPASYALLRGLEMLGDVGPLRAGGVRYPSLCDAAEALARQLPGSPRLATLRARVDGGATAGRAALALNPAYAPAQVALGRALLRAGSPQAARALLEAVEQPERIQGGAVALARARVETGEPEKALLAAARETNAPGLAAMEPSIHDPAVAHEVDEVRGLARLALGAVDAGARSLLRAASHSAAARSALVARAGSVEVRGALGRLARDASLSPEARTLAGVLAG